MLSIEIVGLRLITQLGVPDQERASPQVVEADLEFTPKIERKDRRDELEQTIDYAAVAQRAKVVASQKSRRLLETLAEDLAQDLLSHFPMAEIRLELRKFILPDTRHVSVKLRRSCQS